MQLATDKVCFILIKAREFDAKVDVEEPDPGSNPSDEDMREVLEAYADDPVLEELTEFINDLNVDEQIELIDLPVNAFPGSRYGNPHGAADGLAGGGSSGGGSGGGGLAGPPEPPVLLP